MVLLGWFKKMLKFLKSCWYAMQMIGFSISLHHTKLSPPSFKNIRINLIFFYLLSLAQLWTAQFKLVLVLFLYAWLKLFRNSSKTLPSSSSTLFLPFVKPRVFLRCEISFTERSSGRPKELLHISVTIEYFSQVPVR